MNVSVLLETSSNLCRVVNTCDRPLSIQKRMRRVKPARAPQKLRQLHCRDYRIGFADPRAKAKVEWKVILQV